MTGMKIDLDIIRGWVRKWEENAGSIKKASQVAAVMLGRALAENEARAARGERLLKEIITEINVLNRIEKRMLPPKEGPGDQRDQLQEECKKHKKRMTGILREADELLKTSIGDQSIRVGGLLLEIQRRKTGKESVASRGGVAGPAVDAREKIAFEVPGGKGERR